MKDGTKVNSQPNKVLSVGTSHFVLKMRDVLDFINKLISKPNAFSILASTIT